LDPVFSPDSKRLAYATGRDDKCFIVVDGVEGNEYNYMSNPHFSPDSKHVAYWARRGDKRFVVVDGVEGKEYHEVEDHVFSPDSKRLAYYASRGDKWVIVVDGVESNEEYDAIVGQPFFDSADKFHIIARKGSEFFSLDIEITEGPAPAAEPASAD
jgi:Tol biopolymer transport system component